MLNGLFIKMINMKILFLVFYITLAKSIRVDWNTNKGPIVPPTSTIPPIPQPPYREPAPVWEDQSNDIPNPNPYRYVLPPPSRPRPATDNYARAPIGKYENKYYQQSNYGQIITNYQQNNNYNKQVSALAVQYIPNFGYKYSAIIPSANSVKTNYLKENDIYDEKNEKLNDRYNAKLKKYKAYEKLKYMPQYYNKQKFEYDLHQQQLPYVQQGVSFQQQQQQQQQYQITNNHQRFYNNPQNQQSKSLQQTAPQQFLNENYTKKNSS